MEARYGIDSMTQTAENLAREDEIAREDQDAFALRSQQRAERARAAGRLAAEILPVTVTAGRETRVVDQDEQPRPATTLEDLARLKPLLGPGTTITAGNASGLNDGAGAVLLASEKAAARYGLEPLARVTGMASAGVEPRVMGRGPVPAIRKLLARQGRTLGDYERRRDQRGLRGAGALLHARARPRRRRRAREPERRGDRARPPARRERRAARA